MEYRIKKILMAVDFSESANNALRVAIAIAFRHKSKIDLVHVTEPFSFLNKGKENIEQPNFANNKLTDVNTLLSKHKEQITEHTQFTDIEAFAYNGNFVKTIVKHSADNEIDLVIIGAHGQKGYNAYFAGSNAYNLIKEINCPVLSIPLTFKKTSFKSILFPIRNMAGMVEKYQFIAPIIDKNNANVHLLGVADRNNDFDFYKISEKINILTLALSKHEIKVTHDFLFTDENLAEFVLDECVKRDDDLVIISASMDTTWFRLFLGDFTQRLINHSKIPVLTVKPDITPELLNMILLLIMAENEKNKQHAFEKPFYK